MKKTHETKNGPRECLPDEVCPVAERPSDKALFERPWEELVIRRQPDGNYRSFTQCCGLMIPA